MTAVSVFERCMEQVGAGERLAASDLARLASAPDILPLGMLADAARRRVHGARVTYARVALRAVDRLDEAPVPPAARELRITGEPGTFEAAAGAVAGARALAGDRLVSGFSWSAIETLAAAAGLPMAAALATLRAAGLDAVAEIPLDAIADPDAAIGALAAAGFQQLRLAVARKAAAERLPLLRVAAGLQERHACIQAIDPLPTVLDPFRPTTGYDDVKMVALARLAAPNVPTVQVDWSKYGPKLAQVALTFGADDLDAVPASDDAPDGHRRAPIEEVRRNIEAAGFTAAERDGRFNVVGS